jgi:sulfite exporter TauE/SafE
VFVLAMAVVMASLLGSLHCASMCGPLALWAGGATEAADPRQALRATALYHFGRMNSYLLIGVAAGTLGSLVDISGSTLGWQMLAARIAGGLMIAVGLIQIYRWTAVMGWLPISRKAGDLLASPTNNWVSRAMVTMRPWLFGLTLEVRGFLVGALTALLPCGWLYIFALVAAGTASGTGGALVMFAFWLGTVPILVSMVLGLQALAPPIRKFVPLAAAFFLISAGGFSATGRGFAALESISDLAPELTNVADRAASGGDVSNSRAESLAEKMQNSIEGAQLPCCHNKGADH